MSTLGFRTASVAIDTANTYGNPYGGGFWVGQITPAIWSVGADRFELYHMGIQGPSGSNLQVWQDRNYYDSTPRGDLNSWDPKQPLEMDGGSTLYFYWDSSGATTGLASPLVTVWIRTPLV